MCIACVWYAARVFLNEEREWQEREEKRKKRIDEQKRRIGIEFVGFVVSTFSSLAEELL